jgi:hypothetical protein
MKILAASRSVLFRTAAVATLIVIAVRPSFSKRKDDVVIMENGDKLLAKSRVFNMESSYSNPTA